MYIIVMAWKNNEYNMWSLMSQSTHYQKGEKKTPVKLYLDFSNAYNIES